MSSGNESLLAASGSHDQDDRHAHKYLNLLKIFSGTSGPIFTKLGIGMLHNGLQAIIVCSNDYPGLTLT